MEKLRNLVKENAYRDIRLTKLTPLHLSLVPLLSLSSSLYSLSLFIRRSLYHLRIFHQHRLPVPVISVGNLTWGGNGKTPMVEFIATLFADSGFSPLVLTRGYAGGDEANMLNRHLTKKSVKIGVGANRAATAAYFFEKYGYKNYDTGAWSGRLKLNQRPGDSHNTEMIGIVILDDGMQHWRLLRDLEVVMVNGLMPWGNGHLIPLGPLRENLDALKRADIAVVHHADLVLDQNLDNIETMMRDIKESLPIFFSKMAPSHFFKVGSSSTKIPLDVVCNAVILCVSGIGSATAFVERMKRMGALHVDQLDFTDHHSFQTRDIDMIKMRLLELESSYCFVPFVVVTEKDFDRDEKILHQLYPYEVLVLCSKLQIMTRKSCNEDGFKTLLRKLLQINYSSCKPG